MSALRKALVMRNRHFPRLCRHCRAPMARQEDSCWRCGTHWVPEGQPTLRLIPGDADTSCNGCDAMTSSLDTPQRSADPRPEAERQLAAAVERHRKVLASMQELGRPESGQHVAVKAVGRAVHLVSFALRHATESGVPLERLVELTGWEPELVSEAVARAPDPLQPPASLVARLVPAGLDPVAVAQA